MSLSVFRRPMGYEALFRNGLSEESRTMTVWDYVTRLSYIRDPSTIRARVMDRFGCAPDVEWIANHLQRRQLRIPPASSADFDEADGHHFQVRGLLREPAPAPLPKTDDTRRRINAEDKARIARVTAERREKALASTLASKDALRLIEVIANERLLTLDDLRGRRRDRTAVNARNMAASVLRARGNVVERIGKWLGRDHSTVLYGIGQFAKLAAADPVWMERFRRYAPDGATPPVPGGRSAR